VDGHPLLDELREPPAADVEALAAAMARVLGSAEAAAHMGTAAFDATRAGRFSHARRRSELGAIYSVAAAR
jgi:hypothetical protein